MEKNKEYYMKIALAQAKKAAAEDEVPVGAVVVKEGKILAKAHNLKEKTGMATRHAEIVAIERAAKKTGNWWLENCDIFVTLEPCAMCAGAMINSRIRKLYFGAWDPKYGCCGSIYDLPADKRFNHNFETEGGVMQAECAAELTQYFKRKRN